MNTQWLKTLGLEVPKTTDDLFDVLTAFKTKDPNGNGVADEIPLTGSVYDSVVPFVMDAFIANNWHGGAAGQPVSLGLDGDTVQLQPAQDGWRDGLEYLHRLWENGLIDESAFSQDSDALVAKNSGDGPPVTGAYNGNNPWGFIQVGMDDARDAQYDAIPPLVGAEGQVATYIQPGTPGATFVITKAASKEKQKKLIEILDYMYTTEGQLHGQFGLEGVNWVKPADGDVALDENLEPLYKRVPADPDNKKMANTSWGAIAQYNSNATFRNSEVQPLEIYSPDGFERRLFEATKLYDGLRSDASFPYWNVWVPEEDSAELSTLQTNVETFISTSAAEFITGSKDIGDDAAWTAYLDGLDGLGAARYIEIWQNAYDAS
ncbi:hypothetical protein [Microbacterium sp. E-13]|uniref:hypothetical protein n=1 Tax=Microbacterium sp. E-13 TaxID=3404048 RepID=UPI003CFB1543